MFKFKNKFLFGLCLSPIAIATTTLNTVSFPLRPQTIAQFNDVDEFRKTFEARYIVSGSMSPTFDKNDKIIIHKLAYENNLPQRGDIIIFNPTELLRSQNFKDPFVSRIVGLPGETISVKNGKVYINAQVLIENYINNPPDYEYGPVEIPKDAYFVLGDNRNNAYDSHYWGFLPKANIYGQAIGIYCPVERQRLLVNSANLSPNIQTFFAEIQNMFRQNPSLCQFNAQKDTIF